MAQDILNGLLQYVLVTLPLEDKVWFTQQMEQDIRRLQAEKNEIETVDLAVDMAVEDIANRRLYSQKQARTVEVSPRVADLLSGHSWDLSDEELDDMRYKYLAEKYK